MLCRDLRIWSFTAAAARSKSVPTFGLLSPLSTKWDLRKLACLFFPQVLPPIGPKKAIPCRRRRRPGQRLVIRIRSGGWRQLWMLEMKARRILISARERQQLRFAIKSSQKRQTGGSAGATHVLEIAHVVSRRLRRVASAQS